MEYQYWAHKRSGETWAVAIEGGRVVGACGPLYYQDRPDDMRDFDYDSEDGECIEADRGDFQLSE